MTDKQALVSVPEQSTNAETERTLENTKSDVKGSQKDALAEALLKTDKAEK